VKIDNSFIKKLVYLLGDSVRKIPFMVFLFIFLSILDIVGIGLIAPYIALITSPEQILESSIYNSLLDVGLTDNLDSLLIMLSLLLFVVFLIKSIMGLLVNRAILLFCISHGAQLRSFLMSSYQNMPYEEYIERNSSEYIYQIQELAAKFSHTTLQAILRVMSEGTVFVALVLFLAWINLVAVSILAVLIIASILMYDFFLKNKVDSYGKKVNKHSRQMIQGVSEGIEGLKEIRILGKENYFHNVVKKNAIQYSQINVKAMVVSSVPKYMMELLMVTFIVTIVLVYILSSQELKSLVPTLSVFAVAAIRLVPSSNQIMSSIVQIRFGKDAIRLLYDDVKKFKEYSANNDAKPKSDYEKDFLINIKKFKALTLDKVSYKYPGSDCNVLSDISLTIESGESIGIIGSSGSGKTTLIDIVLGLLIPRSGSIIVNDKIISANTSQWRKHIAYLPQQIFLIDNTMRKNIALGVEESEIDDTRVMKAIHQVQLMDVVNQLPNGLDTILGERGVRLSGGQRQRIALARAFYHDRDVLIMDESTSALDGKTENEIVKEMQQFKGKKTVIVIAHRLTTLKHCDRIYKLDSGRIVDVGSYEKIVEGVNS
jgi:ATP-binding cassette, subfamily B, bacterial PglK